MLLIDKVISIEDFEAKFFLIIFFLFYFNVLYNEIFKKLVE
jgi:hypothetical protein